MKVKNLKGTSDSPKCPCGIWFRHWINHTGIETSGCFEASCKERAKHGAHVQKYDGDMSWYIIPLCEAHNGMHGATLEISDDYAQFFVPAKASDNCMTVSIRTGEF